MAITFQEQHDLISRWRKYGVLIERDIAGYWQWQETDDKGEPNGPFSPAFRSFERCLSDLKECFGELATQENC